MPRRPTPIELTELRNFFPQLDAANVWITDSATGVYNCIAYSLGLTNQWINPPQPLASFQALYNGAPYNHPTMTAGAGGAVIDGWATPMGGSGITQMTHGSRTSTSEAAPLWESKLGSWFRITHGRNELLSGGYGRLVTSFGGMGAAVASAEEGAAQPLESQELAAVGRLVAAVPQELRERFEADLASWKATWAELPLAVSSDTRDYAGGAAFERLAAIGSEALPLVLEQLAQAPDGFFLLPLLERLSEREGLVAVSPRQPLESQQSRAVRAVREALADG